MAAQPQIQTKLPENAYRELKPGETYVPMVPPNVAAPEITARSIIFGIVMNLIFSVVATYLALKAGQGIETAIPISILAIGLSGLLLRLGYRRSSLLENINILAISTTSGIVAGGTCFTMPAIYVLELNSKLQISNWSLFLQIFFVPFLGAILGCLMLIPFRRYFVKDMHGKFPFPEGTATNEILAPGASSGGNQAWVLIYSFLLAMAYNFISVALKVFTETFTTGKAVLESATKSLSTLAFQGDFFATLTNKIKAVFFMGTGAYYLGLGFIIGIRYAAIICAGSFLSWFVLIPLLGALPIEQLQRLNPSVEPTGDPEVQARFVLPEAFKAQLISEAVPRPILEEFDKAGIKLSPEAAISVTKEGEEWQVSDKKTNGAFTVRIEDGVLGVYAQSDAAKGTSAESPAGDAKVEPLFVLPETTRGLLISEIVPPAIAGELEKQGHKLSDKAAISVKKEGIEWKLHDDGLKRAFVLKAENSALSVRALTATAKDIFKEIPKHIGIGGIFAAGIISILRMSKVIVTALRQALGGLSKSRGAGSLHDRTDADMSYTSMLILGLLVAVAMLLYFRFVVLTGMPNPMRLSIISVLLALGVAFLFTTVSAWAIAVISTTPISGMTVTTVIITAVAMLAAGLQRGEGGMLATLLVGGVVCTALSMSGTLVTEFKLGYWMGATPRKIQWSAIIASLLASAAVTATIMLLAKSQGFIRTAEHNEPLAAPQANMMASAIQVFLGKSGEVPWILYGTGAVMSVILLMLGISPLAFALGMYLPMEINTSILLGAFVAWLVGRGTKDEKLLKARTDKGILVASGLIAGAAIMDVLKNLFVAFVDKPYWNNRVMDALDLSARRIAGGADPDAVVRTNNWLGLVFLLALAVFAYWDCRRAKPER